MSEACACRMPKVRSLRLQHNADAAEIHCSACSLHISGRAQTTTAATIECSQCQLDCAEPKSVIGDDIGLCVSAKVRMLETHYRSHTLGWLRCVTSMNSALAALPCHIWHTAQVNGVYSYHISQACTCHACFSHCSAMQHTALASSSLSVSLEDTL